MSDQADVWPSIGMFHHCVLDWEKITPFPERNFAVIDEREDEVAHCSMRLQWKVGERAFLIGLPV